MQISFKATHCAIERSKLFHSQAENPRERMKAKEPPELICASWRTWFEEIPKGDAANCCR